MASVVHAALVISPRDDRALFVLIVACLIGIGATAWAERKS